MKVKALGLALIATLPLRRDRDHVDRDFRDAAHNSAPH
jgi:hypothetical protein